MHASNDSKSPSRSVTTLAPIPGTFYLLYVPLDPQRINSTLPIPDRGRYLLICMKGTPALPMSLSRSPSPRAEGGWSSPGLTTFADGTDNVRKSNSSGNNVTWAGAKKKSELVNGGHLPFPKNTGFFKRHMRSLSNSLPRFNMGGDYSYSEKEKLGRGRWSAKDGSIISRVRNRVIQFARKSRPRFIFILGVVLLSILYMFTRTFQNLNCSATANLDSHTILVAQGPLVGRGQKVCRYSCSKSRRWCNGMEGTSRMGN